MVGPLEMGAEEERGLSAAELGMRLGDWIQRSKGRGEDVQ